MNGKFWGNIGLSVVILLLVAFAVTKFGASTSGIAGVLLPEVKVSDSAEELLHSVTLLRSAVKIEKGTQMVDASFAIENRGAHAIKNISILCTLFDNNDREQGRDKWIVFDTVKSHGHGMFAFFDKKFISESVVRSECQIVDMEIVTPPMITVHRGSSAHGEHEAAPHGAPAATHH